MSKDPHQPGESAELHHRAEKRLAALLSFGLEGLKIRRTHSGYSIFENAIIG